MNSNVADKVETRITWVKKAQAGDLEAYNRLVQTHQGMAVGYACSLVGDRHLAEDAAQEAFIEAYCDLSKLRAPAAFPAWLRKIVWKQCDRILRRQRVPTAALETADEVAAPHADPASVLEQHATQQEVRVAVSQLPEHQRTVVLLFYMAGYSHADIAEFLDVPLHTVKNRLHAARLSLKKGLIPHMEELQTSQPPDTTFADRVTSLIAAAREGNIDRVQTLLHLEPQLARQSAEGGTALHFASWFAHPQVARLLVMHGADLNLRDSEHNSPPIGWARESGQYEMVDFLLELGAKLDICQAAGLNRLDLVQEMLAQDPALIHHRSGWGSPLHEAAGWGHLQMAEFLLTQGADRTLKNQRDETPLDVALIQSNGAPNTPYLPQEERDRIAQECPKIVELLRG